MKKSFAVIVVMVMLVALSCCAPKQIRQEKLDAAVAAIESDGFHESDIESILEDGELMYRGLYEHFLGEGPVSYRANYLAVFERFPEEQRVGYFTEMTPAQSLRAIDLLIALDEQEGQEDTAVQFLGALLDIFLKNEDNRNALFDDEGAAERLLDYIENIYLYESRVDRFGCYVKVMIAADRYDEAIAMEFLNESQNGNFADWVLGNMTEVAQYGLIKNAALKVIGDHPDMFFPCVRYLKQVAAGKEKPVFDAEDSQYYNTSRPYASGGTAITDLSSPLILWGTYSDGTFTPGNGTSGMRSEMLNRFGMFELDSIGSMPSSLEEVSVIICIGTSTEHCFYYQGGGYTVDGRRNVVTILSVNPQEGLIYAEATPLYGANPPDTLELSTSDLEGDWAIREWVGASVPYTDIYARIAEVLGRSVVE